MRNNEWPAEDYAVGSYIQATAADSLLNELHLHSTDNVLDIGCGDGSYSRTILEKVPQGSVLGIDFSENMLHLAERVCQEYPNFSVKKDNALTMNYNNEFESVVSFWCLQWAATDIKKSFVNIVNALKPGGTFFTLFPAGDDPFIMGYYALKEMKQFAYLKDFKAPVDYRNLDHLAEKLKSIPCHKIDVSRRHISITLPNLDFFRKFVNGIAFYQGQVSDEDVNEINEAKVAWYESECQKNWHGEHQFNFSVYLVTGEK